MQGACQQAGSFPLLTAVCCQFVRRPTVSIVHLELCQGCPMANSECLLAAYLTYVYILDMSMCICRCMFLCFVILLVAVLTVFGSLAACVWWVCLYVVVLLGPAIVHIMTRHSGVCCFLSCVALPCLVWPHAPLILKHQCPQVSVRGVVLLCTSLLLDICF